MIKRLIIIIALLASLNLFGEPPQKNKLNSMILECVREYIDARQLNNPQVYSVLSNPRHKNSSRPINKNVLICSDGLPSDFPYDSLNIDYLSVKFMEGNPNHIKKELKKFTTVIFVKFYLNNDNLEIIVNNNLLKRPCKRHIWTYRSEDAKHYNYKYSSEKNKWILVSKMKNQV